MSFYCSYYVSCIRMGSESEGSIIAQWCKRNSEKDKMRHKKRFGKLLFKDYITW